VTTKEIEESIIRTERQGTPATFVGAAVELDKDGDAVHSGIVIFNGNECKLFHFTGRDVRLVESTDSDWRNRNWYYHKVIDRIDEEEIEAFLSFCRNISKKATPRYAFYYDGHAKYTPTGDYIYTSVKGQYMTCVGFCLNVLHGFIDDGQYLDPSTWPVTDETEQENYEDFLETLRKHDVEFDNNVIKVGFKRISPSEFLSSAFLDMKPIVYDDIKPLTDQVELVLCRFVNN